jgi:hypothetical protein
LLAPSCCRECDTGRVHFDVINRFQLDVAGCTV